MILFKGKIGSLFFSLEMTISFKRDEEGNMPSRLLCRCKMVLVITRTKQNFSAIDPNVQQPEG